MSLRCYHPSDSCSSACLLGRFVFCHASCPIRIRMFHRPYIKILGLLFTLFLFPARRDRTPLHLCATTVPLKYFSLGWNQCFNQKHRLQPGHGVGPVSALIVVTVGDFCRFNHAMHIQWKSRNIQQSTLTSCSPSLPKFASSMLQEVAPQPSRVSCRRNPGRKY
jgi:hypothetical protein